MTTKAEKKPDSSEPICPNDAPVSAPTRPMTAAADPSLPNVPFFGGDAATDASERTAQVDAQKVKLDKEADEAVRTAMSGNMSKFQDAFTNTLYEIMNGKPYTPPVTPAVKSEVKGE